MNFNTEYIFSIIPLFNSAAIVTLQLTFLGVFFSIIIGILGNIVYYYNIIVLKQIFKAYTELSRNTPILAQLFFLYFGLPQFGIMLSGFLTGVIALSFLGGSYMLEALRGGIDSISKTQKETAASLALSKSQALWLIIMPQAAKTSLAAISANIIFLLRESSMVGFVAVAEIMHVANAQIGMFFRTNEVLLLVSIYYLVLILPISLVFMFVERRWQNGRA